MIPQNLALLFRQTAARFPEKRAFFFKEAGRYRSWSWAETLSKVEAVAASLMRQGLKAGDRIAILSENRPEWAVTDLAAQTIGAVTVPVYTSLAPAEIRYLLNDSGCSLVAVSNKALFEKVAEVQRSLPSLRAVIGYDASLALYKGSTHIPLALLKDMEREGSGGRDWEALARSIPADAVASIIYTSGTTGNPKGVMLTHENFITNAHFSREALKMGESDLHLSFLPLSHVFERLAGYYLMIYIGASIAYAENMDTVPEDLIQVRPTFILGVPRFYEKVRDKVLQAVHEASPLKKGLFFWAKALGEKRRLSRDPGRKTPRLGLFFKIEAAIAEWLVYKKFRDRLGGRLRFCVSGGAPLPKEVAEFFCDLSVMIYEGYGLTETSPVISANREGRYKFGTVGIPVEGVRVKITPEGEIATSGPCVMKGYFNKPEETREVLKDGWFYTGDLGLMDHEGFLKITGRKKELIVTSGGKKVAPRAIEELLEKDPCILRCVLFGEGKKFITALLVPREARVVEYARAQRIAFHDYKELLENPKITEWMERRVEVLSGDLASFEKIKYFALLEHDFSQGAGELTPTLKVKREVVLSRYKDRLLPFYEIVT
ncbi:MAG: long-chain fatty acid--CoA ligase [Candidatus Omnitrophica bacterium]|nr:long-chain fatty acid--CoA ligase [Candidatus Omnitrophota bacterium]